MSTQANIPVEGRRRVLELLVAAGLTARLTTTVPVQDAAATAAALQEPTAADYRPVRLRASDFVWIDGTAVELAFDIPLPKGVPVAGWFVTSGNPPRLIVSGRTPGPPPKGMAEPGLTVKGVRLTLE
jgi:hypothetical protein